MLFRAGAHFAISIPNNQDAAQHTHTQMSQVPPSIRAKQYKRAAFYSQSARRARLASMGARSRRTVNVTSARNSRPYASRARITRRTPSAAAFPQTLRTTLLYHSTEKVAIAQSVNGEFDQWRLTNPTDPDYTGTGHQPMGWDQYSLVYEDCHVVGAQISFVISPNIRDQPVLFTLRATDIDSSPSVVVDEPERANCDHRLTPFNSLDTVLQMSSKIDVPSFLGKTLAEYLSSEEYSVKVQNSTYNPTDQLIWSLGYIYSDSTYATDNSLYIKVVIAYDCVFTNPRNFSPS